MPINTYSLPDLFAFIAIAPLALIFQISYWFMGRRAIDLFFSNWLVLIASICLFIFIEDNIIPANAQSRDTPNSPALTFFWIRMNYTVALLSMAAQLHFVFHYCESRWAKPRYAGGLYGAAVLLLPVVWASPWFLTEHVRESGENSVTGWANIVPDMPNPGPLVVAFLMAWVVVQVISLVILWRRRLALAGTAMGGALSQINLVWIAFMIMGLGGLLDILASLVGYLSISLVSPASIGLAAFISIALVRERLAEKRESDGLRREVQASGLTQADDAEKPLVFICARSADYRHAKQVHEFLAAHNIPAFFGDESLPLLGDSDYRKEIDQVLDRAGHMVVVTTSAEHVRSGWVEYEWGFFSNEKRAGRKAGNLITMTVGGMKPAELPPGLRAYEVIPLTREGLEKALWYVGKPVQPPKD